MIVVPGVLTLWIVIPGVLYLRIKNKVKRTAKKRLQRDSNQRPTRLTTNRFTLSVYYFLVFKPKNPRVCAGHVQAGYARPPGLKLLVGGTRFKEGEQSQPASTQSAMFCCWALLMIFMSLYYLIWVQTTSSCGLTPCEQEQL